MRRRWRKRKRKRRRTSKKRRRKRERKKRRWTRKTRPLRKSWPLRKRRPLRKRGPLLMARRAKVREILLLELEGGKVDKVHGAAGAPHSSGHDALLACHRSRPGRRSRQGDAPVTPALLSWQRRTAAAPSQADSCPSPGRDSTQQRLCGASPLAREARGGE